VPAIEVEVDVEAAPVQEATPLAAPVPIADDRARQDVDGERPHEHAQHEHAHTHPYPVAADHDDHPHSPSIDHRLAPNETGSLAAAPAAVVAGPEHGMPTFSIVLGRGTGSGGGLAGAEGTAAGAGTGTSVGAGEGTPGAETTFAEAMVSEHARLLSSLQPEYPSAARVQGMEAKVTLEIVVDERGTVDDARVVRGAGHGFDESALRAVRGARFSPARRGPAPVRVRMGWTVEFRLE
jgi:TonB family protein